jgi:spermidine/putrescine transport system ATP-binding protein
MHKGSLVQVAAPSDLYEFPANRLVADFIGGVNLLRGRVEADAADHAVIALPDHGIWAWLEHGTGYPGTLDLWLAVRPEKLELHKRHAGPPALEGTPPGFNALQGTITAIAYLGSESVYEVLTGSGATMRVIRPNLTRWDQEDFAEGEDVWLGWHAEAAAVLTA